MSCTASSDGAALRALVADIRACQICAPHLPHAPRPVVRVHPAARVAVVGQAPGVRVHEVGVPFVDPSGDRLRDWMGVGEEVFYEPEQVAIAPMGFCFPGLDAKGGDRPPRRECAPAWQERVFALLPKVRLVVLAGGYAHRHHLGASARDGVTATVRAWRDHAPRYVPLPHPSWRNNAWIKKNPWFQDELLPDLKRRVAEALSTP